MILLIIKAWFRIQIKGKGHRHNVQFTGKHIGKYFEGKQAILDHANPQENLWEMKPSENGTVCNFGGVASRHNIISFPTTGYMHSGNLLLLHQAGHDLLDLHAKKTLPINLMISNEWKIPEHEFIIDSDGRNLAEILIKQGWILPGYRTPMTEGDLTIKNPESELVMFEITKRKLGHPNNYTAFYNIEFGKISRLLIKAHRKKINKVRFVSPEEPAWEDELSYLAKQLGIDYRSVQTVFPIKIIDNLE